MKTTMKRKESPKYGRCECGGKVAGKRVTLSRRLGGHLYEFENVPAGVCRDCGERVYEGRVLRQIERMVHEAKAKRVVKVPVFEYKAA